MDEIWRNVVGYEGLYEVSNLGRVRSLDKVSNVPRNGEGATRAVKGRLLRPYSNGNGYYKIALVKDGKLRKHFVHRIVAEAFLQNPLNYRVVNHIDFDRGNNRVDNLEWCSTRDNVVHKSMKGFEGVDYKDLHIGRFDNGGNLIDVWETPAEIENVLGFWITNVSACCRGKARSAYGFVWRYVNCQNKPYLFGEMTTGLQPKKTREIVQVNKCGAVVAKYISAAEAQRKTGIWASSILDVAHKGKRITAGGYVWRFADEEWT